MKFYNYALNTEFVTAVGMVQKKEEEKNHNSKAEIISKLTFHSQFLENNFSRAKMKILMFEL